VNQGDQKFQDQETVFIGKIMADLSHEIMNVLAIIRERSGLIEDLMALNKEATFPYRKKLANTLTTIRNQVSRGMAVGEKLNRFAHSMDEPLVQYDVNDLLDQIKFLMQRFARLKNIQIEANFTDPPLTVETDPFRVILVLAACIECGIDRTVKGGEIMLQCKKVQKGTSIQCLFGCRKSSAEDEQTIQSLQARLHDPIERLGAQLELLTAGNRIGLEMILP
jgi:signal transduction histidine kinase